MSIRSDRFLWGRRDIAYHVAHTVTSEILLGGRSRGEFCSEKRIKEE